MKPIDLSKITPTTASTLFDKANDLEQYLPVIRTTGSQWRAFDLDDGCWKDTDRDIYRPVAQAILQPSARTPQNERKLLDLLEGRWQVDKRMFKGALMFDGASLDRILVNVPNGILRVTPDAIDLLEHDRRYGFTRALAARYVPSTHNDLFERVLNESLPDPEDRHLFQLCSGSLVLPDCRFEITFNCFGEAGSGKDTCATPITYALDGGNTENGTVTYLSMSQICDPNCYALAKLRYACVNLCTELDSRAIDESSNYKKIISGNPFEAREIRQAPYTIQPHCKLWALTNEMPRFKNGTAAELRRMRFLPFSQVVRKVDTTLKERLKVACPGVLNFILAGLQGCLQLKGNMMPFGGEKARAIQERFAFSNDPLGSFVREYCTFDPASYVLKNDLNIAFYGYCEQFGFSKEIPEHFFRKLYDRFTSLTGGRIGTGTRARTVNGITLKAGVLDSFKFTDINPPPTG